MSKVIDLLKGAGAVSAVALALFATANSARAEAKNTSNWNAGSFGAACTASPRCSGTQDGTKGQIMNDDGSMTTVRCSSNSCSYSTTPGSGSPARVKTPDKALGTGVGLGGILAGQAPTQTSTKASTGPKDPRGVNTVFAPTNPKPPKVEIAKPVRVDVPKTAAPAVKLGKDVKVNTLR